MKINNLSEKNFITSNNFAKRSEVVFSEVLSKKEFEDLPPNNYKIIYEKKNEVCYLNPEFILNENDVIFTNTEFVNFLFRILKKIKNLKNIKLVTHWSDKTIEKKMFLNRPKIISKWFGVHINHIDENLISIPLGLSGNYSEKNLVPEFFKKIDRELKNNKKENLMYINFQKNTNNEIRNNIYKMFENCDWVKIDYPNLNLKEYFGQLKKSKFVLCPFGNGFDTHRLWETIYSGSIPIIIDHPSNNSTKDLPVLILKNFNQINEELLNQKFEEFDKKMFNTNKLDIDYWIQEINKNKLDSRNYTKIKITTLELFYIKNYYNLKQNIFRLFKILKFRLNQIINIFQN